MRTLARNSMRFGGLIAAIVFTTASCKDIGLAQPTNNDGSCAGSQSGCITNTGTPTLSLSANTNTLTVGQGELITATYDQVPLLNSEQVPAALSDSTVISGNAFGVEGLAVGDAQITATWFGSTASIDFTVQPNSNGASALVTAGRNSSSWFPPVLTAHVGWLVWFDIYNGASPHNIVFDSVPGAPANIATTATGAAQYRLLSTAGTFPYHCTVHGETGVVTVVSP